VIQAAAGVEVFRGEEHSREYPILRAFRSVFRSLFGNFHRLRIPGSLGEFRSQHPAIVELEPAPAAVEELPLAGDPLHNIQKAAVEFIDTIWRFQLRNAVRAAHRAAAGRPQMIPEPPRDELLPFAFLTFIDRHVTEAFKEGPVNTTQFSTALAALQSHGLFITQFACTAQGARQ